MLWYLRGMISRRKGHIGNNPRYCNLLCGLRSKVHRDLLSFRLPKQNLQYHNISKLLLIGMGHVFRPTTSSPFTYDLEQTVFLHNFFVLNFSENGLAEKSYSNVAWVLVSLIFKNDTSWYYSMIMISFTFHWEYSSPLPPWACHGSWCHQIWLNCQTCPGHSFKVWIWPVWSKYPIHRPAPT